MVDSLPSAVLFCCTMNSIRSPMAEGILKRFHGNRIYVDSAGVRAGGYIDGFVVEVMEEIGIDLSGHRCKVFDELEDDSFDVIVSLSPKAQHRAVEMTRFMSCEVVFWNTFDASLIDGNREVRLNAYRAVRDDLMRKILARFPVARAPSG
ncbi:low molecular weight phosphatase family protein [Rhodospirillum rubrum]|uniref:arsenate-mycothiol transferase ArsC n=1 Tax=Rhodospirillum rubrum TaxID=1085 RepID=UPI001908F9B3|nr:arsenate reductase ArsC [Rhodospirillum rubrum]MBK1663928.1 low molecular weight phosphatase family protein [Rhodospirillum rubrum]MBK1676091.1 low molecular weight phosphatase family protein [Rhodospirillum rubrum]